MRVLRRVLITVALLVALLLVADRVGAYAASRLATRHVRADGASSANVRVLGFPFLTQVVRGDLRHVTVSEQGLTRDGVTVSSLHATGRGVHVSLSDALAGRVQSVPVDAVDGTAVISYATLSSGITRALGLRDELMLALSPADSGHLTARVTGPLGIDVSATLPVPTVSGGQLQLGDFVQRFASLLPDGVAARLALPLPALPYGLTLGSATTAPDGVHLAVTGRDIAVDR